MPVEKVTTDSNAEAINRANEAVQVAENPCFQGGSELTRDGELIRIMGRTQRESATFTLLV
jgi:hypothetical protein